MSSLNTAMYALNGAQTISTFAAQRKQAGAIEDQGAYQSAIFSQDAKMAEAQAADAIARGREAELRQRTATKQFRGAQRAGFAAQGVVLDSGSARDVQEEGVAMGELDALTIRNNARREAYGFQVQAGDLARQGKLAELSARNQAASLRSESYGTLLTGAANTYNIYRRSRS